MKNLTSRENPTCKQLKKLADSARERRKAGKTLLDGVHLVEASLAASCIPELLAVSESGLHNAEIAGLLARAGKVPQVLLADALFAEISPVESPTGLLAVIEIPTCEAPENPDFCLLLEDVQDPGNLGSILRSAAAAGVQVAWLSPGCCDAWSPRVLRGGMGAHFILEIGERANLAEKLLGFSGLSLATSLRAEKSLYELDLTGPLALLVGNEGAGVSPALLQAATERVTIPMPGRVESLNAAAATAICLFERVRQKLF